MALLWVPMVRLVSMHMFHAASSSCWHLNNTENRTDTFNRISPSSSVKFFRQKPTVINPLLLRRCITLMLHPWMCWCSCPGLCVCNVCVPPVFPWQGFHKALFFIPFFPLGTPPCIKTPPLLVSGFCDWHAAAYFPQWCLLCPVVLCSLCLSHVSIFRMNQWYILPLTSSTSQSFHSLSYDCTSIQNGSRYVQRMSDKLEINHCTVQLGWDGN